MHNKKCLHKKHISSSTPNSSRFYKSTFPKKKPWTAPNGNKINFMSFLWGVKSNSALQTVIKVMGHSKGIHSLEFLRIIFAPNKIPKLIQPSSAEGVCLKRCKMHEMRNLVSSVIIVNESCKIGKSRGDYVVFPAYAVGTSSRRFS